MSISGELRGAFPRMEKTIERKDANNLRDEDRETIEQIATLLQEQRWETVGSGRSGDVILLDIWRDTKRKPWVVKQENRRTREQEKLNTSIEEEFRLHMQAYDIIQKAKLQQPEKVFAHIPQPFAVLRDESRQWLLIDYIPGENLFERTLRQHLLAYIGGEDEERVTAIKTMRHDELIATCMNNEFLYTLPPRIVEEYLADQLDAIDQRHWRMLALGVNRLTKGPSVVLNAQQYEAINNTIQELHRNGFHHRDLHASNIQVQQNGDVAILDFGLSFHANQRSEKSIYMPDVGHEFHEQKVELLVDDQKMKEYWDVARKIA